MMWTGQLTLSQCIAPNSAFGTLSTKDTALFLPSPFCQTLMWEGWTQREEEDPRKRELLTICYSVFYYCIVDINFLNFNVPHIIMYIYHMYYYYALYYHINFPCLPQNLSICVPSYFLCFHVQFH